VKLGAQFVRRRRDDREAAHPLARRRAPSLPQPGDGHQPAALKPDRIRLLARRGLLPFVEIAEIGFIAVLHSWGQNLHYHPHVDCLVAGGGLSLDGTRWVSCRPGFFSAVRVLSRLFRRLFLEYLQASFEAGELAFFGSLAALAERIAFPRRLTELRRVEWVVYAKRPFAGPDALLAYLGRYTHRVAISNTRLIALADGRVSFRWRDYRHHNKSKVITLAADEFIRRFLLHALPDGFHRIRHYGFLANRHRADKPALCRRLLATPAPAPIADDNDCSDNVRNQCPCCGGQMEQVGPFPRSSPVSRSAWRDSS